MAKEKEINEIQAEEEVNALTPNDSTKVSVGKGKVGGYISSAAKTVNCPTDASSALPDGFANLGYVSEDGITNTKETETEDKKDLNGDTVLSIMKSRKETFKFKLLETQVDVLKEIYGQGNIDVTPATSTAGEKIKVKSNSNELPIRRYCFEFVLTDGSKMRKVVPLGKVTELGDEVFSSGECIGYEATITCTPDDDGNTAYTYIERPRA